MFGFVHEPKVAEVGARGAMTSLNFLDSPKKSDFALFSCLAQSPNSSGFCCPWDMNHITISHMVGFTQAHPNQ